ncbi:MAG TPA: metal-dependent hydrolase [Terracidiphilus sp.]|nr:metal-dependent hydrolase [Terracidiphilus sp.]
MEPVTHFLTGACIGRAGLNRKTAYATLAAVLAAEAADLDILWGLRGPVDELKHHRGITHTFWAVPVVAGAVVGAVWLFDKWREKRRQGSAAVPIRGDDLIQNTKAPPPLGSVAPSLPRSQPIRWGWLYLTACIAALSHILLDWTNNYGVRPLFPLNPHWYAGSFMFIVEPILYGLFFLAFVIPWLLGLADREIGAKRAQFRGQGWAIFALAGMLVLGCVRWAEHAHALALVANTDVASEPVARSAAEPYPVNPFRWHAILETPGFYQTAEINTRTDSIDSDPARDLIYKPAETPAVEAAKRTPLGQVYLDWGTWAVIRDLGQEPVPAMKPPPFAPGRTWTTVEFSDLRFNYSFVGTRGASANASGRSPLSGWVYIVDGHDDAGEALGNREQR